MRETVKKVNKVVAQFGFHAKLELEKHGAHNVRETIYMLPKLSHYRFL